MARPLLVMFLSARNQTIVNRVFLELRDICIENFKILSTLFSFLHFAIRRSPGHEDSSTSAAVSVAAQKVLTKISGPKIPKSTQLRGQVGKLVSFRTMTYAQANILLCTSIHSTPREERFEQARWFRDTHEELYINEHSTTDGSHGTIHSDHCRDLQTLLSQYYDKLRKSVESAPPPQPPPLPNTSDTDG